MPVFYMFADIRVVATKKSFHLQVLSSEISSCLTLLFYLII
jgi:hypothetical protein